MAKGVRSKVKRANRAALRESLTKPIIKHRTEKIAQSIKEELKKSSGSTIASLRKAFGGKAPVSNVTSGAAASVEVEEDEDMNVDDTSKKSKGSISKEEFTTKKKGSKPRHNPGKELVWF